jgi:hypothetical protein
MTASVFDPLKAAKEELAGLIDVQRVLLQRESRYEEAVSMAENELNAIRKIIGHTRLMIDAIRKHIATLEK